MVSQVLTAGVATAPRSVLQHFIFSATYKQAQKVRVFVTVKPIELSVM